MPLQGVDGIVGGADKGDIGLADQATGGHVGIFLQQLIAVLPDAGCAFHGQRLFHAEELLQLQVAPVVHGVADGHFQRLSQLQETLVRGLVAGNIILRDAVGTHHAPLVVVACVGAVGLLAAQPNLYDVVEAAVLVDLLGVQVAVIVTQGHLGCVVVVKMLCGGGFQDEVIVVKGFHGIFSAPLCII